MLTLILFLEGRSERVVLHMLMCNFKHVAMLDLALGNTETKSVVWSRLAAFQNIYNTMRFHCEVQIMTCVSTHVAQPTPGCPCHSYMLLRASKYSFSDVREARRWDHEMRQAQAMQDAFQSFVGCMLPNIH